MTSFLLSLETCTYANMNKWGVLDAFNLLTFELATIAHKSPGTMFTLWAKFAAFNNIQNI